MNHPDAEVQRGRSTMSGSTHSGLSPDLGQLAYPVPESSVGRARRWLWRHRMLLTSTSAAGGVALIAVIIGLLAANGRQRDARWQARQHLYVNELVLAQ